MIQERSKPTFLRKLYPNTKLWMSLALTLTIVLFGNTKFSLTVLAVSTLMIFLEKYYLEFKVVAVAILIMAAFMFTINGTLNPVIGADEPPVFVIPLINWKFYTSGLLYALGFFQRIAPMMAGLFLLFRTMNMTDLGIAMNQGGLPYRASFIFITTFQMLPQLSKEMNQIMDAQRARGLKTEGNMLARFKSFIPIMVPVVANSIMKVQQQAIALETKGFNSEAKKTIYRDLSKRPVDHVMVGLSILASLVAIAYRVKASFFA